MSAFRFKQFEVSHDLCAMKVGTDGVLLGAWAIGGRRILDIGTGTGLIAMMMAQRFPDSEIHAIDLDVDACRQATENVARSVFRERITIEQGRFQDFHAEGVEFDSVVSNPPFFVDSMKCPDVGRTLARHADSLPCRDLFVGVKRLLSAEGEFSVVVPSTIRTLFLEEAYLQGFKLVRECAVRTVQRKPPRRFLLAFSRNACNKEICREEQVLTDETGARSAWYAQLTADFYL